MSARGRIVYRVLFVARRGGWVLRRNGAHVLTFRRQQDALRAGAWSARRRWLNEGRVAQLVLHGRDGRFRWERTYGRDPRRHVG